ncbi:MAG: IS3 family transposase [Nitrosopumilus sp.]
MTEKRKKYTPAEKAKIALEAIRGELTLAQISSKYGVHSTQVNSWKKRALTHLPEAFSDSKKHATMAYENQISELYEKIGRLEVENDFFKKKSEIFSMDEKRTWIEPGHPLLSVRQQCALLGFNRSTLYYRPRCKDSTSEQLELLRLVDELYTKYPFFGTRQMSDYISLHHKLCKRHEVRWAYEKLGLKSTAPGPLTSKAHAEHKVYPYLLNDIEIVRPCQVFSTDITYIRLSQGFAYLTAIIDWYSRLVLDWQLSISMEADFCIETLERVLLKNTCDIFNTDQGSQFTSKRFTGLLELHGIKISMDSKGRALDNIFVERLWRSVKYECIYLREWNNVTELRKGLRDYFQFYNFQRPHQSLNGMTPTMVHTGGSNVAFDD